MYSGGIRVIQSAKANVQPRRRTAHSALLRLVKLRKSLGRTPRSPAFAYCDAMRCAPIVQSRIVATRNWQTDHPRKRGPARLITLAVNQRGGVVWHSRRPLSKKAGFCGVSSHSGSSCDLQMRRGHAEEARRAWKRRKAWQHGTRGPASLRRIHTPLQKSSLARCQRPCQSNVFFRIAGTIGHGVLTIPGCRVHRPILLSSTPVSRPAPSTGSETRS
jgi:hypothetical protein